MPILGQKELEALKSGKTLTNYGIPSAPAGVTGGGDALNPTAEQLAARASAARGGATYNSVADALAAFDPVTGNLKTVDPTIAGSGVRRYGDTSPLGAATSAAFGKGGALDTTMPDENAIREKMRNDVQAQIDAINSTYASLITGEKRSGENRAGAVRATNARSGLAGSDFGNANNAEIQRYNDDQLKAIEAERNDRIVSILTGVQSRADAQIQNEKNRAASNTQAYLQNLEKEQNAARTDVINLAKTGVKLEELKTDEYENLLKQSGYTPAQIKAQFILNKPADQILTQFTQGRNYYVVTYNPVTKEKKTETIDLGFEVPQGYETKITEDGTAIFYPSKFDPKKPMKDQVFTYNVDATGTMGREKQLKLKKLELEIDKLTQDIEGGAEIKADLQNAAAAIEAGADPKKVRQVFLDKHPKAGDIFIKYNEAAY